MYLNPSELEQLPRGTIATKANIKITQLTCRTAFDTNSSNTTIAVQNENQIGQIGVGLNKINGVFTTSRKVTAVDEQFKIQKTNDSNYDDIVKKLYGVGNDKDEFYHTLPDVITNNPTALDHYLTLWNLKNNKTQSWYPINTLLYTYLFNNKTQQNILELTYDFKNAPLTKQQNILLPNAEITIPNKITKSEITKLTEDNDGLTMANMKLIAKEKYYNRKIKLTDIIEKGNITNSLNTEIQDAIQPSIHIGLTPIYKKANHLFTDTEIVNTQTTYMIETELICKQEMKNLDIQYNKIHTNFENIKYGISE